MLELMRRHAGNWIIKILLGAIALAFALSWGVTSYYSRQQVAVKVNGEPITMSQIQEELSQLTEESRRQFGAQYDRVAPLLNLKERALERLEERILLFQAARDLGILVSDQELRRRLAATQAFQRDGQFDIKVYQRVLANNRLTPEAYETMLRGNITMEKLSTMVLGSALASPLELEQTLEQSLAKVQGVSLLVRSDAQKAKVQVSPEEISTYYQAHQREYQVPEKIKFSYMVLPKAAYKDQAQVTEDDLADAYERDRSRYVQPEAVHVRHILIRLPEQAAEAAQAQAKQKAEDLLAQARQSKEDFLALAKKPAPGFSIESGDLGFIQRGQTVPAFEEAAFALQTGQMSVVRSPFGWHVIQVVEHRQGRVAPLEEVKGELKARLIDQQTRDRAEAAAEHAFDQLNKGAKLADVAQGLKLKVAQSPLVAADEPVPGLSGVKGLFEAFEGLSTGQAAPVFSFDGGSVVAVLDERAPEQTRPLEEVKDDVRQAVLAEKAQRLARQQAQDLIAALAKEKDPAKALAAKPGAKVSGWLGEDEASSGQGADVLLLEALLPRSPEHPLVPEPIKVDDGFLVAVQSGKRPPSPQDKAAKRQEFAQRLQALQQREVQDRFMADLKAKADVKVLAKF